MAIKIKRAASEKENDRLDEALEELLKKSTEEIEDTISGDLKVSILPNGGIDILRPFILKYGQPVPAACVPSSTRAYYDYPKKCDDKCSNDAASQTCTCGSDDLGLCDTCASDSDGEVCNPCSNHDTGDS